MYNEEDFNFFNMLNTSVCDMKNSLGLLLLTIDDIRTEMPPQNEKQVKYYSTLQYQASRMNGELIKLLTIHQLEQGNLKVQSDECIVLDTLEEQLALNDPLMKSHNLTVHIECDYDLIWHYDSELIGSVIQSIMINLSQYTSSDLTLCAVKNDKELIITIANDGEGYTEAMLNAPQAFKNGTKLFCNSSNFGLYYAYKVATLHVYEERKGAISLSNSHDLNEGVFTLTLP